MNRIKELLRRIDAWLTVFFAGNPYLFDTWLALHEPAAYILIGALILLALIVR